MSNLRIYRTNKDLFFTPLLLAAMSIVYTNADDVAPGVSYKIADELFQLEESEQRQRELQTTRLALEKEITVKKNSISIDRLSSS